MVTVACGEVLLAIHRALVATAVTVVHHIAKESEPLGELLGKVHRHIVLSVVGITRSHILVATSGYHRNVIACLAEQVGNQFCVLFVVVAPSDASRSNQRAIKLSLGLEVKHIVLASLAHLGDFLQFAPLVINLDFAYQFGWQVFEGKSAVATEETLTIDIDFVDGKTVIGYRLVLLVVFQAWHSLQEFFEVSPIGSLEGIGIDDRGVALHLHLFHGCGNDHIIKIQRFEDRIFFLPF